MKERTTKTTDPLDQEVDFQRFGPVRRNPFSGGGEPGGPTLQTVWEIPELASDVVLLRRGHPGKGRKRKTVARSVRFPEEVWKEFDRKAEAKQLNVHQAMRAALLRWLRQTR